MSTLSLPADLEDQAIARHDKLRSEGKLFYSPSTPKYKTRDGFKFQFRLSPSISKKPILSPNAPGRSSAIGPFVDPDPDFVICKVSPAHTLELSMYAMHRPTLLLHTNAFVKQSEDLTIADWEATWSVVSAMERRGVEGMEMMVLYNCGAAAGSSQGHKHLQIFPLPRREEFLCWVEGMVLSDEAQEFSGIPYRHFAISIPPQATAEEVSTRYFKLLDKAKAVLSEVQANAYNVVATKRWMVLIPRTHVNDPVRGANANGAGMMGLVWVKDQMEMDAWVGLGLTRHLRYLGVAPGDGEI